MQKQHPFLGVSWGLTLIQPDKSKDCRLGKSATRSFTGSREGLKVVIARVAVSNQWIHVRRMALQVSINSEAIQYLLHWDLQQGKQSSCDQTRDCCRMSTRRSPFK
jgi:hypothetical protein